MSDERDVAVVKKRREAIFAFESALHDLPEHVNFDELLTHHFSHKVYGRELFIPAGTMVVGKIHRNSCLNIILTGKVAVATEDGESILEAPLVFVSRPGIKRAVLALEDTRWITAHGSEKTDLEELEEEIIVKSYDALEAEMKAVLEQTT